MRTFILYARKARTDANFSINHPSKERMDIVARCVQASLSLSREIRKDAELFAVLNGPPAPPKTLRFKGSEFKGVAIDEISIARCIKNALSFQVSKSKQWMETGPGVYISSSSFQDVIGDLVRLDKQIYILHEKGADMRGERLSGEAGFVVGDHIGLPLKEERFCERFGARKISAGPKSYLASQCIALVNAELDREAV